MAQEDIKLANINEGIVLKAITEANKEGVFAGLTGGLVSAVVGQKVFKFGRNTALGCGVAAGVLSGYFFAEAFRATAIAQLRREDGRLSLSANAEKTEETL